MSSVGAKGPRPRARCDGLIIEEIGAELLIYDLERDRGHTLNESAALVFRHCDGRRGVRDLAGLLSEVTGGPVDESVVLRALQRLDDAHLLEAPVPAERHQWSRREALRRIGMAGAAAGLAVPVVSSIVVPTAAEAQASCTPNTQMCGTVVLPGGCVPSAAPCCAGLLCQGPSLNGAPCTCVPD
jgi:hypothetical protein